MRSLHRRRAAPMPTRAALAALLSVFSSTVLYAQADPTTTSRLVGLGKLWGYVKYHHPSLASRADIDWDAALVAAIPKVRAARNAEECRAALQNMLAILEDPLTRVSPVSPPATTGEGTTGQRLAYRMALDSILVITAGDYYALTDASSQTTLREIVGSVPKARALVIDLRSNNPTEDYGRFQLSATLDQIARLITTKTLSTPGERRRVFYGFENSSPFSSGQYRAGFFVQNGERIRPAEGAHDLPSIVLLNRYAGLPGWIPALQAVGQSLIIFDGDPAEMTIGKTESLDLADGLVAHVRVSEPVHADGTSAQLVPDVVMDTAARGNTDAALDSALALARGFRPSTITRRHLPATSGSPAERSYATMEHPALEYRLLAAFRLWNTIHYFYPYKHLLDQDWDSVLPEFIPKFEQARDAIEYSRTVAEMATRLHDSHAYVAGKVFSSQVIGNGYPPIRVRMIEGQPVVTSVTEAGSGTRVKVGDVVISVDGEEAQKRLARYAALISASTPQSLMDKAALSFMNGAIGSPVRLKLRDGANVVKAIIFDMRGYPNGTIWAIAPRLTDQQPRVAFFETPLVGHGSPAPASEAFYQTIGPTPQGAWLYAGRTVMLMDERSQSQAEHTGLFLRAANGTRFVGSPTAGADGEITTVTVPGAITVGFTGQSVRYPDGKQLQRIGLLPDIAITPTISGIREGRDEVLEKAIQYLNQ